MRKLLSTLLLALLCVTAAQAQMPTPVRWKATAAMTSATEGVLTLQMNIDRGWHVYSFNQPADGPHSLAITFGQGTKLIGKIKSSPAAKSGRDDTFEMTLSWWSTPVTFTQRFKVPKGTKTLKVNVSCQACDDSMCLPPKTETLNVPLPAPAKKK